MASIERCDALPRNRDRLAVKLLVILCGSRYVCHRHGHG